MLRSELRKFLPLLYEYPSLQDRFRTTGVLSLKKARQLGGIGIVEGWRGETLAYVHLDEDGRVLRYFPRDPSWLNWPALEAMIEGLSSPIFHSATNR